jgi:uncharacterized repeat protein (TIGR03803 family)
MAASAQSVTTFFNFDGLDGSGQMYGSLIQGTDGNFYGTSAYEGKNNTGALYGVSPAGSLVGASSFCAIPCIGGSYPYGGLTQAANGNFYGAATFGGGNDGGTLFEITPAGAFKVLEAFPNGDGPSNPPMQATNGNLYGIAGGGANNGGEIYQVSPTGAVSTFYSFCSPKCSNGSGGNTLVEAPNKKLYGVNGSGGSYGLGTFYMISLDGHYTKLHSFKKSEAAALNPIILASDGNFYGTSAGGGANNAGTIFKITPGGQLTVLYNFCSQSNCTDGVRSTAALVEGSDGNLYGTTELGGSVDSHNSCISGCGTLFQITPAGAFTTLYSFCTTTDCSTKFQPMTALMQATDGNFYGTAGTGVLVSGVIYQLSMGLGPFVKATPSFSAAGNSVRILGYGLTGTTSVSFNGTPATFTVLSDTNLKATVPAGATSGDITVTTPSGVLKSNFAFHVIQ